MLFRDRRDAGRRLAAKLAHLKPKDPLVLAIPRGGVVVAHEIAEALGSELSVIVPRKLGAPYNPELAIGAVGPDGSVILREDLASQTGATEDYIRQEVDHQLAEVRRRERFYLGGAEAPPVSGRVVVLVDDGVATGHTIAAAVAALKKRGAREIAIAVPVGPPDTISKLASEVEEVVCLAQPQLFYAVGQFYMDFDQTSDEEVKTILREHNRGNCRET